jgi:hypothetical protein
LCNFIHSLVNLSLSGLNILRSLMWETKFHVHTKQLAELWVCIF